MRQIVRQSPWFFGLVTLAGVLLRAVFIFGFPSVTIDSFVYGDIAKNWLQHGIYGLTDGGAVVPTFIRLPGYPAFLAAIFALFGMENYRAVLIVQIIIDLCTCFLIADLARRIFSERISRTGFLLAALCPFFANYCASALTETLEILFTVLALDFAVAGLQSDNEVRLLPWVGCGLSAGAAILLRPDGGILMVSIGIFLIALAIRRRRNLLGPILILAVLSLAPLFPWAVRNLHTLHKFQPLAPRYANEENEFVPMGFNRWIKTWIADYASVEEVYWQVPGSQIDFNHLPNRATDNEVQRAETSVLISDYNQSLHITPALDARFASHWQPSG